MRFQQSLLFLLAITVFAFAQNKNLLPLAERLAAQNALFDEQYESDLREFPERATSVGDYRYNDKLADRSLAAMMRRETVDEGFLKRLEAISTAGFSDQDHLSHDVMERGLQQRIADFELKEYEMPISQFGGANLRLRSPALHNSRFRSALWKTEKRGPCPA